jgi:hypothetical protein
MKKAIAIITMLTCTSTFAGLERSPTDLYPLTNLMTKQTTVTILAVDNVPQACEQISVKRGNGGFKGAPMQACSFWTDNTCTIIVPKMANNDMLGHELHHCFTGAFH